MAIAFDQVCTGQCVTRGCCSTSKILIRENRIRKHHDTWCILNHVADTQGLPHALSGLSLFLKAPI